LINYLGPAVLVLHRTNDGASLELAKESLPLEETVRNIVGLIRGFPPEAKTLWKQCDYRALNVGIQAGHEPSAALFVISNEFVTLAGDAGFDIMLTVYAAPREA
jgi:hypothetical protein